jgi:hypothetical protein
MVSINRNSVRSVPLQGSQNKQELHRNYGSFNTHLEECVFAGYQSTCKISLTSFFEKILISLSKF